MRSLYHASVRSQTLSIDGPGRVLLVTQGGLSWRTLSSSNHGVWWPSDRNLAPWNYCHINARYSLIWIALPIPWRGHV